MATLEEIYAKVLSDEGERQALAQAVATQEGAAAFLAERGCDARPEELAAFFQAKASGSAEGELGDAELESAAGGSWFDTIKDWFHSWGGVSSIGCIEL